MRIGYCTIRDPLDKKSLSGLDYYMINTLKDISNDVIQLTLVNSISKKIMNRISSSLLKYTNIDYRKSPLYIQYNFKEDLRKKINLYKPELLFVPNGAEIIPTLKKLNIPIVYFSDATFKCMDGYYENFTNMSNITKKWYDRLERVSISRANSIIYSSQWAANSAINDYGCPQEKINVIPCGGNLVENLIPSLDEILSLRREKHPVLKILYIGSNWKRKGGDIVLHTFEELNRRNIECHLTICGEGPDFLNNIQNLDFIGRLDQDNQASIDRFHKLYLDASLFFVPSRSECFGFIFPEAAAFGLPIVSTRTGGIPQYVDHGKTGYLLSNESTYHEYANTIEKIWTEKNLYRSLSLESRKKYENELNWPVWGEKIYRVFKEVYKKS